MVMMFSHEKVITSYHFIEARATQSGLSLLHHEYW